MLYKYIIHVRMQSSVGMMGSAVTMYNQFQMAMSDMEATNFYYFLTGWAANLENLFHLQRLCLLIFHCKRAFGNDDVY